MKKVYIYMAGIILAGIVAIQVYRYIDFKRHIIGQSDGPTSILID